MAIKKQNNYSHENFGVEELVRISQLSANLLRHRLKTITKLTVSQFIHNLRLQKAYELLQQGELNVAECGYMAGFRNPIYFNRSFHEHYGFPPGRVKKILFNGKDEENTGTDSGNNELMSANGKKSEFQGKQRRNIIFATSGILGIILLAYMIYSASYSKTSDEKKPTVKLSDHTIAVIPFNRWDQDDAFQYYTDGIASEIHSRLSSLKELKTIQQSSSEKFRESSLTIPEIANELGANYILKVSAQHHPIEKLTVYTNLIDAGKDRILWSGIFNCNQGELFDVLRKITLKVARKLQIALSFEEKEMIGKIQTHDPDVCNEYLSGRYWLNKRTKEGMEKSLVHFEQVIEKDPGFYPAYTRLAEAYFVLAWSGWYPRHEGYLKAKKLALNALEIDENLSDAHMILGTVLCWNDWNWEDARKELIQAIKLNPNNSAAYQYYSEFLDITGDNNNARDQIEKALQLNPFLPELYILSALYYYHEGRFNLAVSDYVKAAEIDPKYTRGIYTTFFKIYFMQGEDLKAIESFQKYMLLDTLTIHEADTIMDVYQESGRDGLLKWIISLAQTKSELTKNNYWFIATLFSMMDNRNEALSCLNKIIQEQHSEFTGIVNHSDQLPRINNDPVFFNLRSDPRFQDLLHQMGLTGYTPKTHIPNIF